MKREGRLNTQTFNILVDSTPTAGIFKKVSTSKPTNHSKSTGKSGKARYSECHLHPSCKSSEKSKGSKILKAQNDDGSSLGMSFTSSTASEILAHLAEEVDAVDFEQEMEFMDGGNEIEIDEEKKMDGADEIEIDDENKMDGADEIEIVEEKMDCGVEDETTSFSEFGYFWEHIEGEDKLG